MKMKGLFILLAMFVACTCHGKNVKNGQPSQAEQPVTTDDLTSPLPLDSLYRAGLPRTSVLCDCDDRLAVFMNHDKKCATDENVYITSLYVFDLNTRRLSKLLTTTEPEGYAWYKPSGVVSERCELTDIHAIYGARIFPYTRKLIVSGCFDMRNAFSYIVGVDDKSVVFLPTNGGLVGFTMEEGYAVMQSYEYNTALDEEGDPIGGRHTLLSIFDEDGTFINSLDLEQK